MKYFYSMIIMLNKFIRFLILILFIFITACTSTAEIPTPIATNTQIKTCPPTLDDEVSPSYIPNSPEKNIVGTGHVITGVVLSSVDCKPIANAKLEFWPEYKGLGHPDSARATFFTDENGQYRFECDQPEHIHMRISAEGYVTIGVNSYHPEGASEGTFDIVLRPE